MRAVVLTAVRTPLFWTDLPDRQPGPGEVRVKVRACGVCRTDLHVVDGELPYPHVPVIPGHKIIGRIDALGGFCTLPGGCVGRRFGRDAAHEAGRCDQ